MTHEVLASEGLLPSALNMEAAVSSEGKEIGASCGTVILGVMMGSRVHGACVLW